VPLVANVLAQPLTDPTQIRQRLVEQVTGTVRWRESMMWIAENGVGRGVEVGSKKILSGLLRRIAPEMKSNAVGTPDEVRAAATELSG
jgi:[acyl-carrier-protein] S-malonyltransferase